MSRRGKSSSEQRLSLRETTRNKLLSKFDESVAKDAFRLNSPENIAYILEYSYINSVAPETLRRLITERDLSSQNLDLNDLVYRLSAIERLLPGIRPEDSIDFAFSTVELKEAARLAENTEGMKQLITMIQLQSFFNLE